MPSTSSPNWLVRVCKHTNTHASIINRLLMCVINKRNPVKGPCTQNLNWAILLFLRTNLDPSADRFFSNPTPAYTPHIQTHGTHTLISVADFAMLEAFGHHAITRWNHFKIPPRSQADSVEERLAPIFRDSHLTSLQRTSQRWLPRRRGFAVVMGNDGITTHTFTFNGELVLLEAFYGRQYTNSLHSALV